MGSYLSRQEFGSSDVQQPGPDSGYVSHGSGGGYPKLLMQPSLNPMRSFTMSIDRGFQGPGKGGPAVMQNLDRYVSMKTSRDSDFIIFCKVQEYG